MVYFTWCSMTLRVVILYTEGYILTKIIIHLSTWILCFQVQVGATPCFISYLYMDKLKHWSSVIDDTISVILNFALIFRGRLVFVYCNLIFMHPVNWNEKIIYWSWDCNLIFFGNWAKNYFSASSHVVGELYLISFTYYSILCVEHTLAR